MEHANYELSMRTIQQNNAAVSNLNEGRVIEAFQLLSKACRSAHFASHCDEPFSNNHYIHHYTWVDCSKALAHNMKGTRNFKDGSLPFLFLQFLRIEPPMEKQPSLNVRGFIWVLWYNLATVSLLLGTPNDECGNRLLKQCLDLFLMVQSVMDPQPLSKHWLILKLSILNNEACVFSDLDESRQRLDRLIKMGLALRNMSDLLDPEDQEQFLWTIKTMAGNRYAAAA